jgi:hypothetical protein
LPKEKTDQELLEEAFAEATAEETGKPFDSDTEDNQDDFGPDSEEEDETKDHVEEPSDDPQSEEPSLFKSVPDQDNGNEEDADSADEIDYKALYEKEVQKTKSWEGRIRAANKRAEEAQAALEAAKNSQQDKPKKLPEGGDENDVLSTFVEEFPELEQPLKLLIKKEATAIAREHIDKLKPTVEQLEKQSQQSTMAAHFKAIEDAHPGWRQYVDSGQLVKWIEVQPSYLQKPLMDVYQQGSSQEVIELLTSFKESTIKKPKSGSRHNPRADQAMAVPSSPAGDPITQDERHVSYEEAWAEATAGE